MDKKALTYLVYVWTRDAEYTVDAETEKYTEDHVVMALSKHALTYSDEARAEMAKRIVGRLPC